MNKELLTEIYLKLDSIKKHDDEVQHAFSVFHSTFASGSVMSVCELMMSRPYIDGICTIYPDMRDSLEWFAYEFTDGQGTEVFI